MFDKLETLIKRYNEIQLLISDPVVIKDKKRYVALMQEYSNLSEINEKYDVIFTLLADVKSRSQELALLIKNSEIKSLLPKEKKVDEVPLNQNE